MKVAFISNIHGNAVALDAVLNDIKKKEVDKIYVLGDICYRGPLSGREKFTKPFNTIKIGCSKIMTPFGTPYYI